MVHVGIDNGSTGTIAMIVPSKSPSTPPDVGVWPTPTNKVLHYTKEKKWIHRLDHEKMLEIFVYIGGYGPASNTLVTVERPMVNPMRWQASLSAIMIWESLMIALEKMKLPYQMIDSRTWQQELLPHYKSVRAKKGEPKQTAKQRADRAKEMKAASLAVAHRLFPYLNMEGMPDGDALLIAEYSRRHNEPLA